MRKFLFKVLLLIMAAIVVMAWLRPDAAMPGSGGALGMDDSSGWLSANLQSPKPFDVLEAAQVRLVRISLPWQEIEPAPDGFAWSYQSEAGFKDYDQLLALLDRRGMQAVLVLEGGPAYGNHFYPQQPINSNELLARWENFVNAAVARYGRRVNYWQIGTDINEPQAWGQVLYPNAPEPLAPPDPQLYGEMLRRAHSIIKSSQPGDNIILGSLTLGGECSFSPLAYLNMLADLNLWYAFDTLSVSLPVLESAPEIAAPDACGLLPQEATGMPLTNSVRAVKDMIQQNGTKSLWVQGLAFDPSMLVDQAAERGVLPQVVESDYLTRASALLLSNGGAERVFLHYDPLNNMPGVLALQSIANLNHTLGKALTDNRNNILSTGTQQVLRFRSGSKLAILTWRSQQGDQPEASTLDDLQGYKLQAYSTDAPALKAKHGVALPIDAGGGTALMLSERPVLIIGQPADLKKAASLMATDLVRQTQQRLKAQFNSWLHAQKARAADKVGVWVEEQQKSLLDLLKDSFSQWLRRSLGLAKT